MESNLEIAILGGCIAAGTIFFTILLIRRLCDLIIFLLFATAVLSPFVLQDIFGEDEIYAIAFGLGILMPILTMPLWSISKILRGNEDIKQNAAIKKLENRINSLERNVNQ